MAEDKGGGIKGKSGPRRGGLLAARRLLRCHPFTHGRIDPVPQPYGKTRGLNL